MKILLVGNTAAVPQTLVMHYRKRGFKAQLIFRKQFDIFQAKSFVPDAKVIAGRAKLYMLRVIFLARKFGVIHIHSLDQIIPSLRRLYPRKKILLTYHGTDIRDQWDERKSFWEKADIVSVSTIDLMEDAPEEVIYTPNPVDREHYKRFNPAIKNTALFTHYDRFDKNKNLPLEIATKEVEKRNLSLTIVERDKWGRFKYTLFPRFLELFEYYIDARISHLGELIPSLSLTALQALALGNKVIYFGEVLEEFPKEHEINNVVDLWLDLYSEK